LVHVIAFSFIGGIRGYIRQIYKELLVFRLDACIRIEGVEVLPDNCVLPDNIITADKLQVL
jgi:hypothetical protein